MKLFQALLVLTIVIQINIPTNVPKRHQTATSPDSSDVSPTRIEYNASSNFVNPAYSPPFAIPSSDSLQKQFERAVWNDDIKSIRVLIAAGVDVNALNGQDGYAALHWAVERRLSQTVKILLESGADIDLFTSNAIGNDRTALHIAAELGYAGLVRTLLEHGADVNRKTIYGESPLHGVRLFVKEEDVIQLLIDYGADVDAVTAFGTTPLHAASLLGAANIAGLFIKHGASVDRPDSRGLTPLHHAAQLGHIDVVEKLIEANIDINAQTRAGDTAMHLAAKKGHSAVVRMLLDRGANPLTLNKSSKSPLTEAQERAYDSLVEMLSGTIAQENEG